jgi:hypothetical protein
MLAGAPARAQDGTFGRTTIGTTPSGGMQADFKRGSKFTLTTNGTIQEICAYLDTLGGGSGAQTFRYLLYRDDHGVPGAKLVDVWSGPFNRYNGQPAQWDCLPTPLMPLSAGDYWLAIQTGGDPGVLRYYLDGPNGWFGGPDAFADGASDPFGSGGAGAGTISIYAKYTQDVRVAGRTTVASSRSGGMTANQKRASSFTVSGTGMATRLTAYLDGLGGMSGVQYVQPALYRDANGVPGELVSRGGYITIHSGQPGTWLDSAVLGETKLTPGKYWLALLSSLPGGVARYALDGTGNWYGNADTFTDDFSNPFGAGNPGNGTMSAYLTYQPGTFTPGQFGRADVARTPLKGLRANFLRGSKFEVPETGKTKLVNALYAYLDGYGGASGSQAVRMALYFDSIDDRGPIPGKVAESGVINIPAGTPPGWVRFPVPPTGVADGPIRKYWIVLHSGGTDGVVRSYGGGAPNWRGISYTFSDGAPDPLDGWWDGPEGDVTLSVYATYDEFHANTE